MKALEMTFGVEIETFVNPQTATQNNLRVGGYHNGIQVPYLPAGWVATYDGSISGGPNTIGAEIVSPVLTGRSGLAQVVEVVKTLKAKGHRVNTSCGVHVHVGWNRSIPSVALARLLTIVAYVQIGLYAITGSKARERGTYCKGIRQYGNDKAAKPVCERDRYHALNLKNLATGSKETVEFRCFSGSLNEVKIAGWIQVCLGLVERAQDGKRSPKWNPEPLKGGWAKAGKGASETERLIGYLCWAPGYAANHGGNQFGWLSNDVTLPSQDAVKAEFRRLAKKYDEQV